MTKIKELKKLGPQQRADCLERLFKKNKEFFAKNYPVVAKIMRPGGAAPFHIHVTDEFLTITNTETGELCHPEVGLDQFAEALGDWTSSAWIDLVEGSAVTYPDHGKYSLYIKRFNDEMFSRFPGLRERMNNRMINLPELPNGKHFSNSVVFMGLFHGLQVDHYLSRTQLRNAVFIEPDPCRFVLSCYFLDYEMLDKRFDNILLHVGEGLPDPTIDLFFTRAELTGAVWVRVLPGYADDRFAGLIHKIRLKWRQPYDVWHPPEWQLAGMQNVMENIRAGKRIFAEPVALSAKSRIAVVGAGPSLSNDLDWLKQNQEQLVIMAVHSAVSALRKSGVTPDFQFSLDIHHYPQEHIDRLQLDPAIPIIDLVNDLPGKYDTFEDVLMLPEEGGINPVRFNHEIPYLSPTTGNMALAFACYCKPEQIYLFGLDFGFRLATQTHTAESSLYQSEAENKKVLGSGHLPVAANFAGVEVVTQAYLNLARIRAVRAIFNVAQQVAVLNCSDGARIEGTVPYRTSEIELRAYDKSHDVQLIGSMFVPLQKGVHWFPLPLDGATQLAAFKKSVLRELKMGKFNWLKFSKIIDNFGSGVRKGMPRRVAQDIDRRLNPYLQVVNTLLITWYRLLCFANTEQEWQPIYEEGYAQLATLIDEMEWLDGL